MPEALARFGSLSRGIVYVLIGGIAARVRDPPARQDHRPGGGPARILTGSGGRVLLWIVVAGLFAFVLFRIVQGVRTHQRLARALYFMGGLGGLVLAIASARVLCIPARVPTRPVSGSSSPVSSLTTGATSGSGSEARSPSWSAAWK